MSDKRLPRLLQSPAVILLLIWMLVPLGMTLFFSFIRYVLTSLRRPEWTTPSIDNWRGFGNYQFVWNNDDFWLAIQNSLFIVCSILFGFNLGTIFAGAMAIFASVAILYNTSNIIHHYRTDQSVSAALSLFASVALLFFYILQIFMSRD